MSNDIPLTEDDKNNQVIVDSISAPVLHEFLVAKGLNSLTCELCGCGDWMITSAGGHKVDTIAQTIVSLDPEGGIITAKRPFVFIFCAECGNTKQMYADLVKARLSPEEPESKALLDLISQSLAGAKEDPRV